MITIWETIWAVVLLLALTTFSAMAVLVTIGGARDLIRMIKDLKERE